MCVSAANKGMEGTHKGAMVLIHCTFSNNDAGTCTYNIQTHLHLICTPIYKGADYWRSVCSDCARGTVHILQEHGGHYE